MSYRDELQGCTLNGIELVIQKAFDDRDKYKNILNKIASMCGNPDAIDACRLILKECQEDTKDDPKRQKNT